MADARFSVKIDWDLEPLRDALAKAKQEIESMTAKLDAIDAAATKMGDDQ